MAILKCHKFVSMLIAVAVVAAPLLVSTQADAASGLFRMKRTWWGGTGTTETPDPYISKDFHPRATGPNKAPPAAAYVGSTSPAPRFTAPSKFIVDYTYYGACVPGTCFPGYPESKAWYSYWNLKGSFRPNNSNYGGASGPTTVIFATTMGNPTPPLNQGNPVSPTTTPCVGGGHANCGYLAHDLGTQMAGDPISFVGGNYDHSRAGSIMVTPGANRFGGTMHFFYGANHTYYQKITANYPYISKAYGPQMDVRTPSANTVLGDVQYSGPFNVYRMTTYGNYRTTTGTPSSPGGYYSRRIPYFLTLAPFTTGMITVWEPHGATNTVFTLTGYDNRTPSTNGGFQLSGVISMVRPRLVHTYQVPRDAQDPIVMAWAASSAWQMDFFFLPEPGSTVMMASGLVVLAGLYRLRRR
jgi:hypothetical protein